MAHSSTAIKQPPVYRLILLQGICAIALAAVGYVWKGGITGYSVALGGMIATVPNAWFAWRVFRYNGTREAERIVGSFYLAEAGKFALLAVLFALVFKLIAPLHASALFGAFIVTQLAGVVASIWVLPAPQMRALQDIRHNTRD